MSACLVRTIISIIVKLVMWVLAIMLLGVVGLQAQTLSPQKCILKVRSKCGTPVICDSDPPFPLRMTTTVSLTQKVKWGGSGSWEFALSDATGKLSPLASGCIGGQPSAAEYGSGQNLTLNLMCQQLPRELQMGDTIWISVFRDSSNPDFWLFYNIPIEGFIPPHSQKRENLS
jgi:hypothetical protein